MSPENVEKLRAAYAAFNRGDFEGGLRYMHPDVELRPGIIAPDSESRYRGHGAVREFFTTIATGPWETVNVLPSEIIETENGRILSVDRWRFRGRDGIEIDRVLPNLFTFRDGLVVRIDGFTDVDEALEAAGLSE